MKVSECRATDQIFQHIDGDVTPHVTRFFNASALMRHICANPDAAGRYVSEFSDDLKRHLMTRAGVEMPRVLALPPEALRVPALAVNFVLSDGSERQVIIDGNHRLRRLLMEGANTFRFFLVEEPVWKHFLVEQEGVLAEAAKLSMDELQKVSYSF